MTEFLKNNPMTHRHCMLYEYLQKKPVNVCHIWFDRFKQGIFYMNKDEEPITDMRDVLRSDKYALRACILYESIKYKQAERVNSTMWPRSSSSVNRCNTTFSIYNSFCKVVGEDAMVFPEFEFWFYRFDNEDFDLSYERDKDKKTYELMDMPVDVMKNVVEYLDIFDRTSRSLRTFIEDQKLFHHTLKLNVSSSAADVSFGGRVNVSYSRNHSDYENFLKMRDELFRGLPNWKRAILDLKSILKSPKLHLDTLEIVVFGKNKNVSNDLEDALKFTHHLNVKKLTLKEYSWGLPAKIVPMLKPGYLTTIYIVSDDLGEDSMNAVFETEQWKQVKNFRMEGCFIWPLHHLYHFKEFTVELKELSVENIRQMKETLFKSPTFEKCSLTLPRQTNMSIFGQEFSNALREDPYIYHYLIPNSTEYFVVKVERYFVGHRFEVTRKKK